MKGNKKESIINYGAKVSEVIKVGQHNFWINQRGGGGGGWRKIDRGKNKQIDW